MRKSPVSQSVEAGPGTVKLYIFLSLLGGPGVINTKWGMTNKGGEKFGGIHLLG